MDTSVLVGPQARDLDIKVRLDFMSRNTRSFQEGACCRLNVAVGVRQCGGTHSLHIPKICKRSSWHVVWNPSLL